MRARMLAGAAVLGLLVALLTPMAALAQAETTTTHFTDTLTHPDANPCTGATGTTTDDVKGVTHVTELPDGSFHTTTTETDTFTFVPDDPSQPTYTGKSTTWFGANLSSQNNFTARGGLGRTPPRHLPAGRARRGASQAPHPRRARRRDRAARAACLPYRGPHADGVGIETDRGLLVGALLGAGYQVYGINPLAVSRYRDRHSVSGAKSDRGDAKVLADLVRTDRHNHRQVAGDSPLAEAVKLLARAHQRLVWTRQDQVSALRSALREFYPGALVAFGTDLASRDALAVLGLTPTPTAGRRLSQGALADALRHAGRKLRIQTRAAAIQAALQASQLEAPVRVTHAYRQVVTATVAVLQALNQQLAALEEELEAALACHPQAPMLLSQPGLGVVLAARVLGEFGDDRSATPPPRAARPMRAPRRSPAPRAPRPW